MVYDGEDHFAMREAAAYAADRRLLDHRLPVGPPGRPGPVSHQEPVREPSRAYRRWAFESAALDLGLRQAGRALPEQLGRELQPLNYVVSMRLGPPPMDGGEAVPETSKRMLDVLERYPGTRFKLDPTNTWSDDLIDELAASGAVDSLDLKGQYKGTPVDVRTDPELYAKLIEAFPDAWLEDPDITDETRPLLEPHRDRVTWDAPIHSVDDILALEWLPRTVNIKPSRVGSLVEPLPRL